MFTVGEEGALANNGISLVLSKDSCREFFSPEILGKSVLHVPDAIFDSGVELRGSKRWI
jgi:hypothetical protein